MDRNLDGVYFRIERDGHWKNVCFSDLDDEEMEKVLKGQTNEWLFNMCKILGKTIRDIGDQLDISVTEA